VPAADRQTVRVQTSYGLVPIGWVQSALRALNDAPNQRDGAPRAWIRFDEQVAEGAKDLRNLTGAEFTAFAAGNPALQEVARTQPAFAARYPSSRPTRLRWPGPPAC